MRLPKLTTTALLAAGLLTARLLDTTPRARAESPTPAAVAARIQRVENGLLPGVRIQGRTPRRMALAEWADEHMLDVDEARSRYDEVVRRLPVAPPRLSSLPAVA